jgi:cell division septation protein DedD
MGASVADGVAAAVAGGAVSFRPEQAMAATATSKAAMPRQTPACVRVFI